MIWVRSFILALVVSSAVTVGVEAEIHHLIQQAGTPNVQKLAIQPTTTRIYDKNHHLIAKFYDGNIIHDTPYGQIPPLIVSATLSTEDRRYFSEPGINIQSTFRSFWVDMLHRGTALEGGSGITQQLVKNVYLSPQKTLQRKITEAVYATDLQKEVSKKQILQDYFDHIFYGENSYGVQEALQTYFGQTPAQFKKDPQIEQIAKSALIAGLPQAPSAYEPYAHPKAALARRNLVLKNMLQNHVISQQNYQAAVKEPLLILKKPQYTATKDQVTYTDYVQYVLHETAQIMKETPEQIMDSGDTIDTGFDPVIENDLIKTYQNKNYFPPNGTNGSKVQSASVFVNPHNGEITGLVGSRTPDTSLYDLNRAYQIHRQTGSAIKPILEYGTALASGKYNIYSQVYDFYPNNFGTASHPYDVHDDDFGSRGWVPMIQALQNSYNISAVWLLRQVGVSNAVHFLQQLGINLAPEENKDGLAMAIGGLYKGVTVLQMAQAYQIYANGGLFIPAHAVTQIQNGKITLYKANETPKRVISPLAAAQMRWMLRAVVTNGTGINANSDPSQMISGKTGTASGNKDIWFVGLTKDYVGAVWMGFDNPNAKGNVVYGMSNVPAKLFGVLIQPLLKIHPDPASQYSIPKIPGVTVHTPVPQQFTTSYVNLDQISVQWNPVQGATSYTLLRNGTVVYQGTKTTFLDQPLPVGTTCHYQLYASGPDGNSALTSLTATTLTPTPTNTVSNTVSNTLTNTVGN